MVLFASSIKDFRNSIFKYLLILKRLRPQNIISGSENKQTNQKNHTTTIIWAVLYKTDLPENFFNSGLEKPLSRQGNKGSTKTGSEICGFLS